MFKRISLYLLAFFVFFAFSACGVSAREAAPSKVEPTVTVLVPDTASPTSTANQGPKYHDPLNILSSNIPITESELIKDPENKLETGKYYGYRRNFNFYNNSGSVYYSVENGEAVYFSYSVFPRVNNQKEKDAAITFFENLYNSIANDYGRKEFRGSNASASDFNGIRQTINSTSTGYYAARWEGPRNINNRDSMNLSAIHLNLTWVNTLFSIDVLYLLPHSSNAIASSSEPIVTGSKTYGLGEEAPIVVDGKEIGTLTINKISTSKKRNQFSDKNPAQVILIEYTYKNTASDEPLYISGQLHFQIIDESGAVCDSYPNVGNKYAKDVPIGAKCTASEFFGLEAVSKTIKLNYKFNMFQDQPTISFELPVS